MDIATPRVSVYADMLGSRDREFRPLTRRRCRRNANSSWQILPANWKEMSRTFRAVVAKQANQGAYLRDIALNDLPKNEVLVQIPYSSLNYKDALAVTVRAKVIRRFPMVCGTDLAGTVVESASADFKAGDRVLVTGHGMSETCWGGYSEFQRVSASQLVPLLPDFSMVHAMALGNAGCTAMLCLLALERMKLTPSVGEMIVTGQLAASDQLQSRFWVG